MNLLPNISIIIPLYNVAKYIEQCLQSVVNQTYSSKIECIIVDDCGMDNSVQIVEDFIANYNGPILFRLLHHDHNRGLSAARNTGLESATGEYIYFLDSDDYVSNDSLEVLVKPLREKDYDIVVGDYETFGEIKCPSLLFEQANELCDKISIFHEYAERQICVTAWNKLCKRSFLQNNGIDFLEGQLHEDDLWTYKCICAAKTIAIQHQVTYFYRQHANSIMYDAAIKNKRRFDSMFLTCKYILEHPCAIADVEDYTQCALSYIQKTLGFALSGTFSFYKQFRWLRKHFVYSPWQLYKDGVYSLAQLKKRIYYSLPIPLGYCYLLCRRLKFKTINS